VKRIVNSDSIDAISAKPCKSNDIEEDVAPKGKGRRSIGIATNP
jgi:hypothetical protein